MRRYWPAASDTTERLFSINAGLDASTVTPGIAAPVPSLTEPVIPTWALAVPANSARSPTNTGTTIRPFMTSLPENGPNESRATDAERLADNP